MFPNQDVVTTSFELDSITSTVNSAGKSPQFDFDVGDFVVKDGKVETVTGLKAVKLWIQKILMTEKNKYKIYNTNDIEKYGVSLLEVITSKQPLSYIQAQVQSIITKELLKNSDIKSVINFVFVRDKKLLNCTFTVNTVYGSIEESVVR
ncbi:hypothetical protein CLOBY_18220 [Clostridium saccharobutylicum]|uniref:DUF2634 domain-containing protein n=1 Tax=Clostridium saccharobutylicum TaxID=169679 RepID=UPI000983D23A|nr:DUF2634 domain-containing protein [Clostridium saccharobutylicum]AQS09691.1 hypothetical protein CLOBY_18220 [Clostridium saccharobutylicum]MBC2436915.1 DUF2634 domain-containing protein [Clostridium saccharobutylicum]NSB89263.1 hypothetical protein [Clostridium saccharobutylicum]NYC27917.1 hypothetical protein [Clostridium saccharobutylicum]OOM17114.1 hypothetical protein CLSAB_20620 [Clostridium saccharobutylicum]